MIFVNAVQRSCCFYTLYLCDLTPVFFPISVLLIIRKANITENVRLTFIIRIIRLNSFSRVNRLKKICAHGTQIRFVFCLFFGQTVEMHKFFDIKNQVLHI